jgi:hypothetical protein
VIFQPGVLTQAEIRNNYKKIILGRWKQWQDHLMLICMFKLDLKLAIVVDAFTDAERQFQTSAPL